jgi:hypothetical protein
MDIVAAKLADESACMHIYTANLWSLDWRSCFHIYIYIKNEDMFQTKTIQLMTSFVPVNITIIIIIILHVS